MVLVWCAISLLLLYVHVINMITFIYIPSQFWIDEDKGRKKNETM